MKGNLWCFGIKIHIGQDKDTGLFHRVEITPLIGSNNNRLVYLLQVDEEVVYGAPLVKDLSSEL
jgi:IS5 family transposase